MKPGKALDKLPNEADHQLRRVGVGAVPRPGDPHQPVAVPLGPGPVVPLARPRLVLLPAEEQHRAGDVISPALLDGLGQDPEAVARQGAELALFAFS